jgi:uncharacterized protein (TIGR03000 family)
MIRSHLRALAVVLGCALVVTAPATARAQHRGGGHMGGHVGGHTSGHAGIHVAPATHFAHPAAFFSRGGNRFFGFGNPGFRFGFGFPRYGLGLGYAGYGFGYPFFGYGYYSPFVGYGVGLGPNGTPFDPFAPTLGIDGIASALEAMPNGAAPPPMGPAAAAKVEVIVPDPAAEVFFDGQKTNRTGTMRVYDTPTLTPGKTYSYQVSAHWTQDGRSIRQQRTIFVNAGGTAVVNFRQ